MLEVVIILMEAVINFAEMVINFVEIVINLSEMVINFAVMVINLSKMVRRVAGRSWGITGSVDSVATVKDRTLGTASSVGSIGGAVVVATADYTLLIYISGRVCSVGRSIDTMVRRSSMLGERGCVMGWRINIILGRVSMEGGRGSTEGGTGSMEGANAQTLVVRVSSAVGSVRTKAIKKGSTEVLPLDVLLI